MFVHNTEYLPKIKKDVFREKENNLNSQWLFLPGSSQSSVSYHVFWLIWSNMGINITKSRNILCFANWKTHEHIMNSTAVNWLYLDVERKNSSDEHILIALVTQSYYAASDPWPLTFDPLAHFKEEIQGKNSHNRPDSSNTINSVGDDTAVEYYFASDARWDTISLCVLWGKCMGSYD